MTQGFPGHRNHKRNHTADVAETPHASSAHSTGDIPVGVRDLNEREVTSMKSQLQAVGSLARHWGHQGNMRTVAGFVVL